MVTKREYLLERQLITGGRGRWSKQAHDAITDAINRGVKFDEPEKSVAARTVTVLSEDGEKKVTVHSGSASAVAVTAAPVRPEGIYVFKNPDGREFKRSHKEACVRCSYSFRWCGCAEGPFQWALYDGSGAMAECISIPQEVRKPIVEKPTRKGKVA